MRVVSGKTIFCEGEKSSLDYALLDCIVNIQCTIVSAGGKFNFSNFIQGYLSETESINQRYIVFRDRDFDVKPTPDIQLLKLTNVRGKVIAFLTHRACVENYFLDANLIHVYWEMKYKEKQETYKSGHKNKWGHQNSPGVADISAWIEASARNLQDYQAVRWALSDLVNMSAARERLKTTWTGNSGKLPESLVLQSCKDKALKLIDQFRDNIEKITPEKFEESLARYQNQFAQENFWTEKDYLIWFHGKDIQKEMHRQKPQYPALKKKKGDDKTKPDDFFDWAIKQLDVTQHPDLVELQDKIDQL